MTYSNFGRMVTVKSTIFRYLSDNDLIVKVPKLEIVSIKNTVLM